MSIALPTRRRAALGQLLKEAWQRLQHEGLAAVGWAIVFSGAIGLSVAATMMSRELAFGARAFQVIETMMLGAFFGAWAGWLLAAAVAGERPATARFAAMLVATTLGTAGFAVFVYFLRFRTYFAAAHDDFPSIMWLWQFIFTGASAAYVFVAAGLRLLLPIGLLPLAAIALIFARRPRGR